MAYCRYLGLLYSAFLASQNIDGHHLKAPVLAILLETVEGKFFCQIASLVNILPCQKIVLYAWNSHGLEWSILPSFH